MDYLHERIAFVFQGFGRYEAPAGDNIAYGDWQELLGDRAVEVGYLEAVVPAKVGLFTLAESA